MNCKSLELGQILDWFLENGEQAGETKQNILNKKNNIFLYDSKTMPSGSKERFGNIFKMIFLQLIFELIYDQNSLGWRKSNIV